MRKFFIIFVFIFLCFILTGCGSNNTVTNTYINNTTNSSNNLIYEAEKINIEPKEEIMTSFSTVYSNFLNKILTV